MSRLVDINLGKKINNKVVITNIGRVVSGDIEKGIINADTILVKDGKIAQIGMKNDVDFSGADHVVDVDGMVVCPGLIDPHAHFDFNDYSFYFRKAGWMEDSFYGGVTTMIDRGCPNEIRGRPIDPISGKALAILLRSSHKLYRAGGGLKAHGGSVVLERGLTENDFKEMAEQGCFVIAEIGGGGLYELEDVAPMVEWGRKYGYKITQHFGGAAIPGGATIRFDDVMKIKPDILVHVNGGPTAPSWEDLKKVVTETNAILEVVFNGNQKIMYDLVNFLKERNQIGRLIIGSDAPVGMGTQAMLAIMRTLVNIIAVCGVPPEIAISFATGNTAQAYELNTGMIDIGREADLLALSYPIHSAGTDAFGAMMVGDVPSITMIMVDGEVAKISPFPYTDKLVKIDGVEAGFYTLEDWIFSYGVPPLPREQPGSYSSTVFKPLGKPKYPK
jgi:enamidase